MKRGLVLVLAMIGGVAVGGGSALAVGHFLPPAEATTAPAVAEPPDEELVFVSTGAVLAPMVLNDGGLAGYATFEVQLQVAADRREAATAGIPLILDAINMRTYRQPLASGPGGQIPDLTLFRKIVRDAADQALGRGTVRQVAITQARPE